MDDVGMNDTDRERLLRLSERDGKLKRLLREHNRLEAKLARFENRPFLTVMEELEQKRLKMRKLKGKDQMMRILSNHSESSPSV